MKKKSLTAKKKIHNSILKHLTNNKILKIYKEFKNSLNTNNNFAVAVSGGQIAYLYHFWRNVFH